MTQTADISIKGTIRDVFAHRFVVETDRGPVLADLGPEAGKRIVLRPGDRVELEGEQKPSELKVRTCVLNDAAVEVGALKEDDDFEPASPDGALEAIRALGGTVLAEPRRKRKHFEILVRDVTGQCLEYHVTLAGEIKTSKPGDRKDGKWQGIDPKAT